MKIGLEARWMKYEKTGFGNYSVNLLRTLSRLDHDNEYVVYTNSECYDETIFGSSQVTNVVLHACPGIYKHIALPWDLLWRNRGIDLFHFLYNAPPLFVPCDYVLTIHDLSYRHIPGMLSRKDSLSINVQLPLTAKKAKKVIAVSENTKKDIIDFLDIAEENIEVIYEGVANDFKPLPDSNKSRHVRQTYNLPDKYILYVGTYLPHKNIETLLLAFHDLLLHGNMNCKLVLAGKKGRNYKAIEALIHKLKLQTHVVTPGYVAEEDLPYVYAMSTMFVFPSLYEGFGLPILEAMASGVPVISSSASCLKEIGGNAALYFSPKDYQALAKCMAAVETSPDLQREMRYNGIRRACCFTWEAMGEKTRKVYESAYLAREQS